MPMCNQECGTWLEIFYTLAYKFTPVWIMRILNKNIASAWSALTNMKWKV